MKLKKVLSVARFASPWSTHYFVDGIDGSDGNAGKEPTTAFKTIQKAVNTATGGDIIYIRPLTYKIGTGFNRYTEDVTIPQGGTGSAATETNAAKSIIGVTPTQFPVDFLGVRWKFVSAVNLNVEAPATHIENIGFFTEGATYGIYFENDGATYSKSGGTGSSVYNCAIKGDGAIYADGTDELQIVHCRFQTKYDGTVGGINLVGSANQCKRPIIRDCEFIGGNANNMSDAPIRGAAPWYDGIIRDCYFNAASDTGLYINISGTNTGLVANCYFSSADISTTSLVTGGMLGAGCYDDAGIQAVPAA